MNKTKSFIISLVVMFLFPLAIPNAFSDGNVHVEGKSTFPFPPKKTAENKRAWSGMVVGVSDGDTITVMHSGKGEKIRLYGIDTPEKRQAFGKKAKQFTSKMVYGKSVEVETKDKDRYGRTVGIVTVDGQSLNEALIKNGLAWVYRKYCKETYCEDWLNLEIVAKYGRIGLWSELNPIPPWEFRHGKPKSSYYNESVGAKRAAYHGNIKSKVFHQPGCQSFNCKNCTANLVNREEAIKTRYRACKICKP